MNKPKPTRTKSTALIPPEGHKDVGKAVFDCIEQIIQDKDDKGLTQWWKRCYELIRNKFWKQSSDKYVLATANLIQTHFERVVNQFTDNEPKFDILPLGDGVDEQGLDKYDIMLNAADFWWRETEQQDEYDTSIRSGETYGPAIEKWVFNPELAEGLGDVETIPIDPFHFGFWPLNAKKANKCVAMFHYRPMSVAEVKKTWGDAAKDVIPDKQLIDKLGEDRRSVNAMGGEAMGKGYSATFSGTAKIIQDRNKSTSGYDEDELVVVGECWYKDNTTVKTEGIDDEGRKIEVETLKYKGGIRRIVACNMGDVVLSDEDNPSINHALPDELARMTTLYHQFPIGVSGCTKDTTTLWYRNQIEHLYPLQADINVTLTQLKSLKDKSARRKLMVPKTAGVSVNQFTNSAGIVEPVNAMEAQSIRWLDDPGIPSDLVQHLEMLKALFFLVSGQFEMDQANTGGNDVVAYKAINALLERSAQINRDRQRNYDRLLRMRGRAYVSLMQNWYTEERFIAFEKNGKTMTMSVNGPDLIVPAKLMVISGSTLPVSLAQRREEAVMLYDKGLVDDQECLKRLDYPDYMNVILRKRQGAYGELFRRLKMAGAPDEIVQYFNEIANMDADKFDSEAKAGKIPPFAAVIQQLLQGGQDPMQAIEMQKAQGEAAELAAKARKSEADALKTAKEAQKVDAEIRLIIEQIKSEMVDQYVKDQGVKLDWKKMEQEAAKLVNDFELGRQDMENKKVSMKEKGQGPYREKGLKSNNKDAGD